MNPLEQCRKGFFHGCNCYFWQVNLRQFITLATAFVVSQLCGQSMMATGFHGITTYTSLDYKASTQNWDAVQDKRGIMYFANNDGVLEFDGESWRLISLGKDVSELKSLAINDNGVIYVGARNEFGYLQANAQGVMEYKSLVSKLPADTIDFGPIWNIEIANNLIYFVGDNDVFGWDGDVFETWHLENQIRFSQVSNNTLYLAMWDEGIKRIKNGSLNVVPGTSMLAGSNVTSMLSVGNDSLWIFVRNQGLMKMVPAPDGSDKLVISSVSTSLDEHLAGHDITDIANLRNGYYALQKVGGLLFIDSKFNEVTWINENEYLSHISPQGMHVDANNFLWLALDNGIARLDIPPSISSFNSTGLSGTIEAINRTHEHLYVATGSGIYYLMHEAKVEEGILKFESNFNKIVEIQEQCWDVNTFIIDDDTITLLAGNNSIYRLQHDKSEMVKPAWPWTFHQSKADPHRIYVGLDNGFESIYWKDGNFVAEGLIAGISEQIMFVTQDNAGNIWLGIRGGGGVIRVADGSNAMDSANVEFEYYTSEDGSFEGTVMVQYANNQVLAGTDAGIFVYNESNNNFQPYPELNEILQDLNMGVHRIEAAPNGELWISGYERGGPGRSIGVFRDGELFTAPFEKISLEIIHAMWHDENGMSWFGGPLGLFRYNSNIIKDYNRQPRVLVRKVVLNADSLLFAGAFIDNDGYVLNEQSNNAVVVLPYQWNDIYFEFAAPEFEEQHAVRYSSKLIGYDEDWSDWAAQSERNFTNLKEGDYIFQVKCRNIYGVESEVAEYKFTIAAPWYRTTVAYASYVVLFALFVYVVIRLSVARVKAQNERLENIIKERTQEIVEQKEEIEQQKEVVEEKNREILDSINYAQRLQQAILPPAKLVEEWLPESFILFKPKDIVSGDFYWVEKIEENGVERVYFAAVDCTGHGVPGAMVSVVGHNGLERCIKEFDLRQPAQILDKLTELVEETFEKSESEVKDGMDIALCCLIKDGKNTIVEYAGANNPLYILSARDEIDNLETRATKPENLEVTLHEIKADKQPIGKYAERKPFTNVSIVVEKEESIILFSDGYADQFGGERGKKFKYGSFKKLLLQLCKRPMTEQLQHLDQTFENWRGELEQVDDVCVIGVRV